MSDLRDFPTPTIQSLSGKRTDEERSAKAKLDRFLEEESKRLELKRLADLFARASISDIEQSRGVSSNERFIGNSAPSGIFDDISAGINSGLTGLGATAARVGSKLPGNIGNDYTQAVPMYDLRKAEIDSYIGRGKSPGSSIPTTGQVASYLISNAPEYVNPFSSGKANALYHGVRSLVNTDGNIGAGGVSSLSNVVGEKIEDITTKGRGIVGNTVGALVEKGAETLGQYIQRFLTRPQKKETK